MERHQLTSPIPRRVASGENTTFGYFEMQKSAVVQLHQHQHEQHTFILKGSLRATIRSSKGRLCHIHTSKYSAFL
ncbi:hypothetical protein [Chitinophaga sp. YR627]|uniref:hypothetical protein n=1 Tax=Chitinophaga sp. YR627 TaxID=1881041 RepID=UPI000B7D67B4|nr:hypothetical protein [Chitinophaga sp. YR627]